MKKSVKKVRIVAFAAILLSIVIVIIMAEFVKKNKKVESYGSDAARGMRNNNPLNLRRTGINWKGEKKEVTDKDFEEFESLMWGLRAGLRNMRTIMSRGNNTIGSLVSVWAPPSENQTSKYIDYVVRETGYSASQRLEFEKDTMYPIVAAMCKMESNLTLNQDLYEEAWANI